MPPWDKYQQTDGPWAKYGASVAVQEPQAPPMGAVVANAAAKGAAGIGDMFLNAPANAWNLGQGAIGGLTGDWLNRKYVTAPNLIHKAMTDLGLIKPEAEPQGVGQRIVDTAVQGMVGMGAGPGGAIRNAVAGGIGGAAAQATKEATGSEAAATGVGLATPFALRMGTPTRPPDMNPIRLQTLKEGRAAGYVVPPTEMQPTALNNRLESLAGKAASKQEATIRNQALTNQIAPQEIGLPKNTPLSEAVLKHVREKADQAYEDIAKLSPSAKDALDELRKARYEAKRQWNFYNKSGNPEAEDAARKAGADANLYEGIIENEAKATGRPELVKALAESRMRIAKTYDIERALNLGSGDVSAQSLGRQLDQSGVAAKSGNLGLIGRFQQAFPKFMGEGAATPQPGVSMLEPMLGAGLGVAGYYANPEYGWMAAGLPFIRGGIRSRLLSPSYQNRMVNPPGLDETALRSLMLSRAIAERQAQ